MNTALAYSSYVKNNVQVESPTKLIEMLYEGILRFNVQARRAIRDNDYEKKIYWINRSNQIFIELISSLDFETDGDMAGYLHGLYEYQIGLLNEANIDSDEAKIKTVSNVVKGLLDAWRETSSKNMAK